MIRLAIRAALLLELLVLSIAGVGCGRRDGSQRHESGASAASSTLALPAMVSTARLQPGSVGGHDPAHPPIDCPLRKQGIDPAHLKPFEEVEKYIAFLERADRATWQKPDEVVAALSLKGSETVVDLGAGSGYFAFRLAKALPKGRVIAADTEAAMVRHIHHRAMTEQVTNVEARIIKPDEPELPALVDLVFVCDVLHHVADRAAWLSKLAGALRPRAKLALIEFKEGKLPEGPPEDMKIGRAKLLSLVTDAGFSLESEHEGLLPYQVFLVFSKKQ
jgi:SAM-dependent methyltransferase